MRRRGPSGGDAEPDDPPGDEGQDQGIGDDRTPRRASDGWAASPRRGVRYGMPRGTGQRAPTLPGLEDLEGRERDGQPGSPCPCVGQLGRDLVPEVPGHDEDDVRSLPVQVLRWMDRDVRPGCEATVLVRVAVHEKVDQVRPDAAVVEKSVGLPRGPVAGDPRPPPSLVELSATGAMLSPYVEMRMTSRVNPC